MFLQNSVMVNICKYSIELYMCIFQSFNVCDDMPMPMRYNIHLYMNVYTFLNFFMYQIP